MITYLFILMILVPNGDSWNYPYKIVLETRENEKKKGGEAGEVWEVEKRSMNDNLCFVFFE